MSDSKEKKKEIKNKFSCGHIRHFLHETCNYRKLNAVVVQQQRQRNIEES